MNERMVAAARTAVGDGSSAATAAYVFSGY